MLKLPIRLTVITLAKTASGCAPSLPTVLTAGAMPAQLTRPISLPSAGGRGDDGLAVGLLADVALDEDAADLLGDRFAALDLQVGDDDLAAVRRQHARRAFAQARRAAGDDEDLACDVHGAPWCGALTYVNVRQQRPWPRSGRRRAASASNARAVISSTLPVAADLA